MVVWLSTPRSPAHAPPTQTPCPCFAARLSSTPQLHASPHRTPRRTPQPDRAAPHAADREPSYDDDDGLDEDEEGDGPMLEDAASNPSPSPNDPHP